MNEVTFRTRIGTQDHVITEKELAPYSRMIGLDHLASGRCSWLFAYNLYLNDHFQGIDPQMVIEEIRDLESGSSTTGTKEATQFQKPPLQGLWHKHYFSARFIPHNILNKLSGNRMRKLAERIFDPSISPVVTREMIDQFAHEVTDTSLSQRAAQNRLTGEWIVFTKHNGQNYYLSATTHSSGDQATYDSIKYAVIPQFPFLRLRDSQQTD